MHYKIVAYFAKHWPKFLFLLLTFFFFYPFFISGKIPLAMDIPTGMYYPWLNQSFGFPVKVPVKNALLTDTISQFWIWRNWAANGLMSGEIKIWNPMSLAGYEMSPWFHTISLSPFNLFYFLTDKLSAISWIIISQLTVSLFSSYIFAKLLFKQKIPAVFFALVWSLSSYFVGWMTWGTISHALASLPLLLYFAILSQRKRLSRSEILFYFLAFCLFLLSGHPQTIAYCLFIWASFICFGSQKANVPKFIFKNITVFLLAIVFLSPVILPSLKVISGSIRSQDNQLNSVNYGLVPVSKVLALSLTPNFYGNPATGNYFGGGYNFQEKLVYFGIIPLFFAVLAVVNTLVSKKNIKLFKIGLFFVFFGLLISSDGLVGKLVYDLGIPILSTSPAGRGLIIFVFGASILSSLGLSLFAKRDTTKKGFFITSTIIFFCFIFCFATIKYTFFIFNQSSASMLESYSAIKANYTTLTRNLVLSFGIFTFSWIPLIVFAITKRFRVVTIVAVLVLTVADSYLFFKKYTPFTPPHLYFPETSSINFLRSKMTPTQIYRIERQSGEIMPPNMWEPYGLSSLSGYDPMANKMYQSYLINTKAISDYSRYVELGQKLDQLNHLGVKYFMVLKRNDQGIIDEKGEHPYYIDHSRWQEVATDGPISILENKKYAPPYRLNNPNGTVNLLNYTETKYVFEVETSDPTEFIFYQNTNSNWSVKVNGSLATVTPEEGTFYNLQVPAGKSQIELDYKNKELALGLQLSLIGLVLLFFVIFKTKV